MLRDALEAWPAARQNIGDSLRIAGEPHLTLVDEQRAPYDYAAALLAIESQALVDLLARDQAERIYTWTLVGVDVLHQAGYEAREVAAYDSLWKAGVSERVLPQTALVPRLLERWVGPQHPLLTGTTALPGVGFAIGPSVFTMIAVCEALSVGGLWKFMLEQCASFVPGRFRTQQGIHEAHEKWVLRGEFPTPGSIDAYRQFLRRRNQ